MVWNRNLIWKFFGDDRGLESVEYAVLLGLIVIGVIASVAAISAFVIGTFQATQAGIGA